jgi:hypothetical protein
MAGGDPHPQPVLHRRCQDSHSRDPAWAQAGGLHRLVVRRARLGTNASRGLGQEPAGAVADIRAMMVAPTRCGCRTSVERAPPRQRSVRRGLCCGVETLWCLSTGPTLGRSMSGRLRTVSRPRSAVGGELPALPARWAHKWEYRCPMGEAEARGRCPRWRAIRPSLLEKDSPFSAGVEAGLRLPLLVRRRGVAESPPCEWASRRRTPGWRAQHPVPLGIDGCRVIHEHARTMPDPCDGDRQRVDRTANV